MTYYSPNLSNGLKKETIIMEIRSATGGKEASLFANELLRMYSKFCQRKNFNLEIIDTARSDLQGIKEAIIKISGENVYSNLKYEGGVHRVQRVPQTEKSGRIHTSTASVAILPYEEKNEVKIKPAELKVETFRASGHGGQHVNRTDSAIRITHIPTGIVVACQNERSQHKNKEIAIKNLKIRLYALNLLKKQQNLGLLRKQQIKAQERADKIRTYNWPQNRVTDHRIKYSIKNLKRIMEGELDPLIKALKEKLG